MKRSVFLFIFFFFIAGEVLFAQTVNSNCGVGSKMWHGEQGIIAVWSADITNVTFSARFSIVSATSDCTGEEIDVMREVEQKKFLMANVDHVAEEASVGQGEYLYAYAYLLGCSENSMSQFVDATQKNYGEIFSQPDNHDHVLYKTKEIIDASPDLSRSCRFL